MKKNLPVSNRENDYPAHINIVSTTDRKGAISSFNDDFLQVSGFAAEELLGKNHNLVRHPDMPPAAFADLWAVIKQDRPWMGIVKNRCKNGDYYWVDAHVIPMYEGNEVVGYQSVRSKPEAIHVERAQRLYRELNQGACWWSTIGSRLRLGLMGKIFSAYLLCLLPVFAILLATGAVSLSMAVIAAGVGIAGGLLAAKLVASPWQKAAQQSRALFDNAVAQQVYTGRQDELGQLQVVIKAQQSQLKTVIWRIDSAVARLDGIADQAAAVVAQTDESIQQQQAEIGQVAAAMQEMTATVQEVASNAADASGATQDADQEVARGSAVVEQTISGVDGLVAQIGEASQVVSKLAQDSEQIGSVVDVIRGVAEQTNLLALNAAIEAARAGEQGRGFAVVADEVRTLASRTRESTDEIQKMIEQLQHAARQTVEVMAQGRHTSEQSVVQARDTGESLASITRAVGAIRDMNTQIATAAEQQNAVSEEIARNLSNINRVAEENAEGSRETARAIHGLLAETGQLHTMVRQFSGR